MNSKLAVFAMAAAAAITMSACTMAQVPAGQTAVIVDDYVMIPTDPKVLECRQAETSKTYGGAVNVYRYPARQISWDATGVQGSEHAPYVVVSSAEAPAELKVPVVVTMDLTTDCEKLSQFHRDFGTKYQGWLKDDGSQSDGWVQLVNYVVGQPLEQTLTQVAQKYTWRQIWNDEKVRVEFQEALKHNLPNASKARTDGQEYFTNFQVTVLKPEPVDANLKSAINKEQSSVAEANAKKAAADAEVKAAQSQTEVARQQALQKQAEIAGFPDIESYLRAQLIGQGGNPYQPTYVVPQQIGPR
ncbi:membrane protease subunit, stomatin/prohibitin [Mycobacteroides abscessus subsp. abscessus]|uniref:membrane protease subunit, stomatin/prohibitin n=1 Tax=Mycobacteroides abscessus TaxID=36809 RepID=UPI0009A8E24E|nr:membrane protease subunit, stomatin/prohibitin [Mycobacteroides abscessus]SKU46183.1 membrane protease subunit, stomatin/prohibitin [Mycobacteroides abscessus subsp. abscessus]